jgi:hypothetical protein
MRNIILGIGLAITVGGLIFIGTPRINATDFVNATPSSGVESSSQAKSHLVVVKTLAKKTTALLRLTDNSW